MRTLHFAACEAFRQCPKLYQLRYLERWEHGRQRIATLRGSYVHSALDKLAKKRPLTPQEKAYITSVWSFYEHCTAPYQDLPVFSEWAFTIPLSLPHERVIVTGRIDRWYRDQERLILIDWKTGASPRQPHTHLLQMRFYAWALWQYHQGRHPIQSIEAQWVYLEEEHTEHVTFEALELEQSNKDWEQLISQMDPTTHQFAPHPQWVDGKPWCHYCHFQQLCPEGKIYHGRHEKSDVALQATGPDLPRL